MTTSNDARQLAWKLLARRPRTECELREALAAKAFPQPEIDGAIRAAREAGHLDDARFAESFVSARAARLGRGRERLLRELLERGVDREIAASAWERAAREGAIDEEASLRKAVHRRLGAAPGPIGRARWARVYSALLREGFDASAIEAVLGPHRSRRDRTVAGDSEGYDDDLP